MKGKCTIQLTDTRTGRTYERTEENMVTNAVNNILNMPPLYASYRGANGISFEEGIANQLPVAKSLLGGVMLWSKQHVEDVDNIICDDIDAQIGYAGDNSYSGINPLRGSYNPTESGAISNGWRHVFDFATHQANGTIRSITLTGRDGGCCGLSSPYEVGGYGYLTSVNGYRGNELNKVDYDNLGMFNAYNSEFRCVGNFAEGVYTFVKLVNGNTVEFRDVKAPKVLKLGTQFKFTDDDIKKSEAITRVLSIPSTSYQATGEIWHSGIDYCGYFAYNGNPEKFYYVKFIGIEKTVAIKEFSKPNANYSADATFYGYAEKDGYLYFLSSDRLKICKMNLSNTADFTEITIPKQAIKLFGLNGSVHVVCSDTDGYVIKDNVAINRPFLGLNANNGYFQGVLQSSFVPKPFVLLKSAYRPSSTWTTRLAPAIVAPYMATINNLTTPVTKTASQTMKLIYTLTDI